MRIPSIPRITYGMVIPYGLSLRGADALIRFPFFMWYGPVYRIEVNATITGWYRLELMFSIRIGKVLS